MIDNKLLLEINQYRFLGHFTNHYIFYSMNFGQYEYQHRFYRDQPHKINIADTKRQVVPDYQSSLGANPYYSPQINHHVPITTEINMKARAGLLRMNDPGW